MVGRNKCANIGLRFFQGLFHLAKLDLFGIENGGIDFSAIMPSFIHPDDTLSPFQGVFADIVSADDKGCLL
jgi:hypothetical protein